MPVAESHNSTALPKGYFPLNEAGPRAVFPLDRGGDAASGFRSLMGIDRPGREQDAAPIMLPEGLKGTEQTLIDRLTAVRPHSDKDNELREAAEQLVSTTLIMPLFDQLRDDPLAANLFHGGQAETMFRRQLDQTLADRIASGSGFDLVDSIYDQFVKFGQQQAGDATKGVDFRA